jgi:DNA-binding CsgD family transcriptional regulator
MSAWSDAFPHRPVNEPTQREVELLAYVLANSQKHAAHRTGLAMSTVKNHLTSLYRRLGVTKASQAAIALGWLHIPESPQAPSRALGETTEPSTGGRPMAGPQAGMAGAVPATTR